MHTFSRYYMYNHTIILGSSRDVNSRLYHFISFFTCSAPLQFRVDMPCNLYQIPVLEYLNVGTCCTVPVAVRLCSNVVSLQWQYYERFGRLSNIMKHDVPKSKA